MLARWLRLLAFYGLLVTAWQLVTIVEMWPSYVLPPPGEVVRTGWRYLENGMLIDAVTSSMLRLVIGYGISLALGGAVGLAIGSSNWLDDTLGSIVLGIQSLPSICWLPLAVLWFGLSEEAIIFVVLMGSALSVAMSARSGVRSVPPLFRSAALTFGANRWQMYRHVLLPAMLPTVTQGLKLGWTFGWRSLMSAELLFVGLGLGHLLNLGRDLNDMRLVLAVMLVITAIGLAVDRLIFARLDAWVERRWGLG